MNIIKKSRLPVLVLLAKFFSTMVYAADTVLPCGIDELLSAAGKGAMQSPQLSARQLFDQQIFAQSYTDNWKTKLPNADGFCATPKSMNTGLATQVQKDMYSAYCTVDAGKYYSYDNLLNSVKAMANRDAGFSIACSGALEDRIRELANLLANTAQETGEAVNYKYDGAYFRYENGVLGTCTNSDYENSCETDYYKNGRYIFVAVPTDPSIANNVYTHYYWEAGNAGGTISDDKTTISGVTRITLDGTGAISRDYYASDKAPPGYIIKPATDKAIMKPYFWIGMGPTQLTGSPMIAFFGWNYNHPDPNAAAGSFTTVKKENADLNAFIGEYLKNGNLGYQGMFFYWNYWTSGSQYPTIHQILSDVSPDRQVCHDIAIVTRMVNGACNDYEISRNDSLGGTLTGGRKGYYVNYFYGLIKGDGSQPANVINPAASVWTVADDGSCSLTTQNLQSLTCNYSSSPNPLFQYCIGNPLPNNCTVSKDK